MKSTMSTDQERLDIQAIEDLIRQARCGQGGRDANYHGTLWR